MFTMALVRGVFGVAALGALSLGLGLSRAQTARTPLQSAPTMPFIDWGACPFEGCVYRDWKARAAVTVVDELSSPWMDDARELPKPAFKVKPGETVTAMTGVVVFTKAGRARIKTKTTLDCESREFPRQPRHVITLSAGDVVYLLTYHGEGDHTVWFKGCLGHLDTGLYMNPKQSPPPSHDYGRDGEILEEGTSAWWVKIRNAQGLIGWTNRAADFDGKDRFGG